MPKIDQDLLERLQRKLGVGPAAVYNRIQKVGRQRGVPRRDVAALLLAWEHDISIQKYANAEQMSRLDRLTSGDGGERHAGPAMPVARTSARKSKQGRTKKTKGNSVFVVHGRDEELRKSIFAFLRALGLNPMEWEHAVHAAEGGNPTISHIIETAMARVQAVVVLFSPDEEARLKEQFWGEDGRKSEGKLQGQPRPNVLFEAGLTLGAHADKTVLVQVGKVRGFSDIAGKHLVRLSNDTSTRNALANRLANVGCTVNKIGNDWMHAGDFTPAEAKVKRKVARSHARSGRKKRA